MVVSFLLLLRLQSLNQVDEVFSFTDQVRSYGARFSRRKEGIWSKSVRNVGTSSTVFATTERPRRKLGLEQLEEILASCN